MENILVPIDFSKDAMNAFENAIAFANKLNSNLRIIHVRKTKDYDKPFVLKESDIQYGKTVEDFCNEIVEENKSKYKVGKEFDYVIVQGKIYKAIIEQAEKDKTDMIIMGTHGVSGFEEFWLGSNSYRVVSKSPCPVLTIRTGFRKRNINKIILPIDAHRETRQKVPFTTELAKMLDAEIHVVDVRSTKRKDVKERLKKYAKQASQYIEKRNIKVIRASRFGSDIADITISYAVHNNADLISIVSNQRGTPVKMGISTTAQQLVNHSPIPILSMHPRLK
jgi:nucleotide-binding universal stress UspA family protein